MIDEQQLAPNGVTKVVAYGGENLVHLDFIDLKEYKQDSIIILAWHYYENKALCIHEYEIKDGQVDLELAKTLMMQMKFLDYHSMRLAVVYQENDDYVCRYLKNEAATDSEINEYDRWVCKLGELEDKSFIVFWTDGGILSVGLNNTQKFNSQFYKFQLSGYEWNGSKFIAYLDAPLFIGEPKMSMCSMTTNSNIEDVSIELIEIENNGIKNLYRMEVELSEISPEDMDGYRFICNLANHNFKVVTDEDTIGSDDTYYMELDSNERLGVGIKKKKDNTLILQTGVYDCMLSIVTAVYNTAPFLAEMIDSVLQQDLTKLESYLLKTDSDDFSKCRYKNIYEFILVDDGSTDGSAEILDDYARIADCIMVIHKENGGVSSARNAGIRISKGKYINFADSDDKLSDNFVSECMLFFEQHIEEVDIVTTPLKFFDALNEDHWCNGKFRKGSRVINLNDEFANVLMFVNASIFKNDKIKGIKEFNESLKTAEDINFIYSFLIDDKPYLGLVSTCSYQYRRRSIGEESLIQQAKKDKNRYLEYFTVGMEYLVSESNSVYGKVPRYIQYLIASDLQWRFYEDSDAKIAKSVLNEKEFLNYKEYLRKMLQLVDVDIIWMQDKIFREQKMFMSKLKYGVEPEKRYDEQEENVYYYYDNQYLIDAGSNYLRIDFMGIKLPSVFYIEGTDYSFEEHADLYICINDEYIIMPYSEEVDFDQYSIGETAFYGRHFYFELKLSNAIDEYEISLYEKFDGHFIKKRDIRYGFGLPLSNKFSDSYFISNGWIIRREGTIRLRPIKFTTEVLHEQYGLHSFLRYERDYANQIQGKNQNLQNAIELRKVALQLVQSYKSFSNKRIWLISDRVDIAGDNGEALFIYINKIKPQNIETYFVINEDCIDYERMKKYGNVVGQGTVEHKLLHFLAEFVISSQMDEYIQNPFYGEEASEIFKDLAYRPKFVFLQHGIIKDDLSRWLSRLNKNLSGFVTSANAEYESIFEYPYMYSEKEIWLTGLPRYDRLYCNEKKYITIMPTWRYYLSQHDSIDKNRIVMGPGFKETDYFKFYNGLLNNERLLENAEKYGYQICFRPHPVVMKNLNDFSHDYRVRFFDESIPYRDIFAESNLCVTDYSSAVMDFAYLRKPVVYVQFDKEKFFSGEHICGKGYFSYEDDGFGEVTYDMDSLIDTLIDYMKNNCKIKEKYLKRIDQFFTYNDKNNCERVYNKLLEISTK